MYLQSPLPPSSTLVLHLSSDGGSNYRYLGHLTNSCPSGAFRRGCDSRGGTIGVSLEDLATAKNLEVRDGTMGYAEGIARDCAEYLGSFGEGGAGRIVEMWFKRFRERFKREGEFWIRR
ncbi:hypothetical protein TrRE_jg9562 [Triparma retinervis]|uniref:Uncharacterized protein n=1 Tax=Triparma retinervis TaxID=2557542 RepID=A0A9W7DLG1_9STRA|nr:hypothetical protein TrRE_jg9562 [Triparma retinervis]